jgi:integrase
MAWIEQHPTSGRFKICFRWGEQKIKKTLKVASESAARSALARLEETMDLLERGRLELPAGADIATFLLSDGKIAKKPVPTPVEKPLTLSELRDRYVEVHGNGAIEANSLETIKMHFRHLEKSFGGKFPIGTLSLAHLQDHISRRSKMNGHCGKKLSPATLRKEISSLRAVWNWALIMGLVSKPYPNRGLRFPKSVEKPPFQTWPEIERKIKLGVTPSEEKDLWDSLYLTLAEIDDLLAYVEATSRHRFLYPMFSFAAFTGARRSEMMRLRWTEVDFESETVTLHEKKRNKERMTSRRVPLSPKLVQVLRDWQSVHPGGQFVFCHQVIVARSRTKRTEPTPVTKNEAHHLFTKTLASSKWKVVRGWHVFRHSFVSNCASHGLDQRMIDEWVGHQTEDMRKRYRHLHPHSQHVALRSVFCKA